MLLLFLALWLFGCAYTDIKQRKLPNTLTLGAYLAALLVFLLMQRSLLGASISSALLAWSVAIVLTLPAYAVGWLAAGDVKMLSALGLMTSLKFMLLSYAIAGIMAGFIVLYSVLGPRYLLYLNLQLGKLGWQLPLTTTRQDGALPFGALLAIGGLAMLALHTMGMVNVVAAA